MVGCLVQRDLRSSFQLIPSRMFHLHSLDVCWKGVGGIAVLGLELALKLS